VAKNSGKGPLFDTATRVKMVRREVEAIHNGCIIEVASFDGLLAHFAKEIGASVIVRGLRAVSDFEYEIQMAAMNYRMVSGVETIFMTPTEGYQFIASRLVNEISRLGGYVRPFVSEAVAKDLERCFKEGRKKVNPELRD
jgi:pantetheine-phosphate adenylyltransferase